MQRQLEQAAGQPISRFCGCGFDDPLANHCAHWVSHFLGYRVGFTCRDMTGRGDDPATLRVHELFPHCPQAGSFNPGTAPDPCLVFIALPGDINLSARTLRNVPHKHVGIFHRGFVHHYSNTKGRVVAQTPALLLAAFRKAYGPDTALFFGTLPDPQAPRAIPVEDEAPILPDFPPPDPVPVFHQVQDDDSWNGSVGDGAPFFVGRPASFRGRRGLHQRDTDPAGPRFDPAAWLHRHGQAAALAAVVGHCESDNRLCRLNTYDRAAFTFGFLQLAAHTPGDNLILLFRRAVALPSFRRLFPDLTLRKGRLHQTTPRGCVDLELAAPPRSGSREPQLTRFMRYLNPDARAIGTAELRAAAALTGWTRNQPAARMLQVSTSIRILLDRLRKQHDRWYDLHGKSDVLCAAIADIHHQGRASRKQVAAALRSADPLDGLLRLGSAVDSARCARLRQRIERDLAAGRLGRHRFDRASGCLIPSTPRPWPG